MTDISLDLSGKVDAGTVDLLKSIGAAIGEFDLEFFVVGATALDMVLMHGYDIAIGRTTLDVDLGVGITSWDMYARLKGALVSTTRFTEDSTVIHRLRFRGVAPVDIIPFGPVESPAGTIGWPPDRDPMMNVLGFEESWKHSLRVRVRPELEIRCSSLPGMTALKLIAWAERHSSAPGKDAADIATLLRSYAEAGNIDRLYERETDVLREEGFDLAYAGARLLGRDMAAMMNPRTAKFVGETLARWNDPERNDLLVIDVARHLPGGDYGRARKLLSNLSRGIAETVSRNTP